MKALVIYDSTGNVWNITYGETVKPASLTSARLEIPDGSQVTGVDLSDPGNPRLVFESIPASDYTNLQNQINEQKYIQRDLIETAEESLENNIDMDYRLSMIELGLI